MCMCTNLQFMLKFSETRSQIYAARCGRMSYIPPIIITQITITCVCAKYLLRYDNCIVMLIVELSDNRISQCLPVRASIQNHNACAASSSTYKAKSVRPETCNIERLNAAERCQYCPKFDPTNLCMYESREVNSIHSACSHIWDKLSAFHIFRIGLLFFFAHETIANWSQIPQKAYAPTRKKSHTNTRSNEPQTNNYLFLVADRVHRVQALRQHQRIVVHRHQLTHRRIHI